ncbi:MAG TPA: hypothetical protein VJX66_13105 [Amycolatopsis sp.]|nr:hypothetical protein [Amycolatopsis sp.]
MRRLWGMFAAACLLGCAAGCTTLVEGSAIPDPIAALSAQSPVIVPSRPTPTFTPTVSPDKVTGACPLISGEEIRGRLKQGADFTYDRMEVPQSEYDGVPVYECKYLGETTHATAFDLAVSIVAGHRDPKIALRMAENNCKSLPKPISGAGSAAMSCAVTDEATSIATVKFSHGEMRNAVLFISYPSNALNYPDLAKLLASRL